MVVSRECDVIRNKEESVKGKREEPKRRIIPQRDQAARRGVKSSNAIIRYFQETSEELRKVSWPTREQTIRLTLIVIVATATAGIFFGALDFLFHALSALLL